MKYKVGDTIKTKSDLKTDINYGGYMLNPTGSMDKYLGKRATIIKIRDNTSYDLDIDDGHYYWTDEMLDDILTFSQLFQSPIDGIRLDDEDEKETIISLKDNSEIIWTGSESEITYDKIPELVAWLQSVYNYCTELKEQNKVEYVDFINAKEYMLQGNKAKFEDETYYIKDDELYCEDLKSACALKLRAIESNKWILIKYELRSTSQSTYKNTHRNPFI